MIRNLYFLGDGTNPPTILKGPTGWIQKGHMVFVSLKIKRAGPRRRENERITVTMYMKYSYTKIAINNINIIKAQIHKREKTIHVI